MTTGIIRIQRTGNTYGVASSEYLVTWPDGTYETIWSPPWHTWDRQQESKEAYRWAAEEWAERQGNPMGPRRFRRTIETLPATPRDGEHATNGCQHWRRR